MIEEFKKWFYSRGEYYCNLKMKFFVDGEPYFSSHGAQCTMRDYIRRKEMVEDIYICECISGSGKGYAGGIWKKKETPKMIVFTQLKESFYQPSWTVLKICKDETKNSRHRLEDWGDGTYTIYPNQCGIPHIFEPIKPEEIEKIIAEIKLILPEDCQIKGQNKLYRTV